MSDLVAVLCDEEEIGPGHPAYDVMMASKVIESAFKAVGSHYDADIAITAMLSVLCTCTEAVPEYRAPMIAHLRWAADTIEKRSRETLN